MNNKTDIGHQIIYT